MLPQLTNQGPEIKFKQEECVMNVQRGEHANQRTYKNGHERLCNSLAIVQTVICATTSTSQAKSAGSGKHTAGYQPRQMGCIPGRAVVLLGPGALDKGGDQN